MCLRFLMEGNAENQAVVRELEPQRAVPNEVLDQHGYETYMDSKGQVLLRRKESFRPAGVSAGVTAGAGVDSGKGKGKMKVDAGGRDPRDLEQLVQQVMRELPVRVQGAKFDAEKAAALAKLDRAF